MRVYIITAIFLTVAFITLFHTVYNMFLQRIEVYQSLIGG